MPQPANYINHIALLIDASGSMSHLREQVVKVTDNLVSHLATRSKELDQETRVSIYTFNHATHCLIYDKDVLRMPSIKGLYSTTGQTAMIDATLKALADLAKTPELYGEHAFLAYVLTDGAENNSNERPSTLQCKLEALPDHWTVAVFVPNATGVHEAKKFGFPKDNIAVWDTTSTQGLEAAGKVMRDATEQYMTLRTKGVRGSRSLFTLAVEGLTTADVKRNLQALGPGQYRLFHVYADAPIAPFLEAELRRPYRLGEAYYQLTKTETIQPGKQLAIYDRRSLQMYMGAQARQLLGLPAQEVRVPPADHPQYDIFVQSTSVNRKLIGGTKVLVLS